MNKLTLLRFWGINIRQRTTNKETGKNRILYIYSVYAAGNHYRQIMYKQYDTKWISADYPSKKTGPLYRWGVRM